MNAQEIENLMTIHNEEWIKGTDLQRQTIDKENAELYDEIESLVGVKITGIQKAYEDAVATWKNENQIPTAITNIIDTSLDNIDNKYDAAVKE
jgi:hypothetical protein